MEPDELAGMFAGVDVLKVSAVGRVIGICEAAIYNGMLEGGMSEEHVRLLMADVHRLFFHELLRSPPFMKGQEGGA
jgi:hypothetical protein